MGATLEIVKHAVRTNYSHLHEKVIEKTKELILDSLGVAFAGSSAPGCESLVENILFWKGKSESTIWFFGGKVPAFHAAMANATMAHAREFDDTHEETGMHCFAPVFPAALAAAEQIGGASGEKLITAVALGADIACRLGQSINLSYSWHPTTVLGTYSAAVAAGKMLELNEEKMLNAIGIAHAHIPGGNRQGREDGALTKRMQPGFAAMNGVLSANLSLSGFTGAKASFEGTHGFFNLYRKHGDKFDPDVATEILLEGLGKRYEVINLSIKPYPACRSSHPAIDAALEIINSESIVTEEIEIINVYVSSTSMEKVGKPLELWTNPQVDAQFSIPYTVAVALSRGEVDLDDFEADKFKNPAVLKLAERIKCIPKQDLQGRTPVTLEIKTKEGKMFSKTVHIMRGEPGRPLTYEERLRKFRNCCRSAAKPLVSHKMDALIRSVDRLEKLNNVNELVELLT